jgi:hypothetical protein
MLARFGIQRCGPPLEAGARLAALTVLVAGCSGDALVVGEERRGPGADADDALAGGIGPVVPPPDVALISDCPPSPEQRQALLGCWPTRHLGSWRGFFTGVPRYETSDGAVVELPTGEVILELSVTGAGHLAFGVPPPGVPASDPPFHLCAPRDPAASCAPPGQVIAGFPYELGELELFDPDPTRAPPPRIAGEPPRELAESMSFVVRVAEPWDIWCSSLWPEGPAGCAGGDCAAGDWLPAPGGASAAPGADAPDERGCRCGASGCRADAPSASLSIHLQMSADGRALRGRYAPNVASLGVAGLELRKVEP